VPGSLFGDEKDAAEAGGNSNESRQTQRACPQCGRVFGNLPNHLRNCDGGESDA